MRLLNTLALLFMTATTALCSDAPLRHVVSFKFKKETPAQEIRKIETAFSELKGKIPQIQSLEWGTDVSPEGLSKGFTHMWIVTFNDLAALKTYIDHPDHVAFVNILKPNLEDVFVLDFHSKK
jgi:hypothetical protein